MMVMLQTQRCQHSMLARFTYKASSGRTDILSMHGPQALYWLGISSF